MESEYYHLGESDNHNIMMLIKLYEDDLSIKMADVLDLFELFAAEDCELTRKEIENNMRKSLNARDPSVFHKDVITIIEFVCHMD